MRYGWSLVRDEWSGLPGDLVNGKVWRSVQFNTDEATSVPASPGIYLICTSPPGRRRSTIISANDLFGLLYTAIYAGKSENLRRRFGDHCRNPKSEILTSRECFADCLDFWFTKLDPSKLDIVEAQLIDCLGPPANVVRGMITARIQNPVPA